MPEVDKVEIYKRVRWMTDKLPTGRCLYASLMAYILLKDVYPDVFVQAGSMSWPIVTPENDDGVSPTHFSYKWSPHEPQSILAMFTHGMPEMHVWLAIPSRKELIDMTTYEIPALAATVAGCRWKAPPPPDFIWVPFDGLPEFTVYKAEKDAINMAMAFMCEAIQLGHVKKLMKGENPLC